MDLGFDISGVMNQIVYPLVAFAILTIFGIALKRLADWLKAKAVQTGNETLKSIVLNLAGAAEQMSEASVKAGNEKWSGAKKKEQVKVDALKFAQASGFKVTEDQIDKMIEGVLGEQKICK
jgi:hypothetical protein